MNDNNASAFSDVPEVDQFLNRLIDEKDYPNLDEEIRAQMKLELEDKLNDFINAKMIGRLSEAKAIELDKMLDQDVEPEVLNAFFKDNIPQFAEVMAAELLNFRRIFLGLI